MDEFFKFYLGMITLAMLVALMVFGIIFIIPGAIGAAIFYGVYQQYNGPAAKARQAEAATAALYQQALAVAPLTLASFTSEMEDTLDDENLIAIAVRLYCDEGFLPPEPPPPNTNSIEGARYRDLLNRYIATSHSPERTQRFVKEVKDALRPFEGRIGSGTFRASRPRSKNEIEKLIMEFFGDHDFFKGLRSRLDQNLNAQKGLMPSEYTGKNCAWDYLKDTPLLKLEYVDTSADWLHPENHTLVLAGSGAGKTTLFKHLIAKLLKEDCCVIVMDSQSQLIEELAHLDMGENELAWITPEHPLALNPFHAEAADMRDEAFVNSAIGQLEFVISKLLDAPMTPRQRTLFYHCSNLVLAIPGGNIQTFFEVMDAPDKFASHIDALDETGKRFFYEELNPEQKHGGKKGSPYDGTKTELSYRLDALLKNPTLRRMFNTSENRFNMVREMASRKLVLIDTSLALLAQESATFGRFMIAQALQACYARVKAKSTDRPVVFFIDEAHEYFDEKLETMLLQARKANVGMVIATQDLARASRAGIADTMLGSTTTKLVSRVVTGDAKRLAPSMKTSAEFLMELPEHAFAFASGRDPAVSVRANPRALDGMARRDGLSSLRKQMAERYGPIEKPAAQTGGDEHRQQAGGDQRQKAAPRNANGPSSSSKPSGSDPTSSASGSQDTMRNNGHDDIKPSGTL